MIFSVRKLPCLSENCNFLFRTGHDATVLATIRVLQTTDTISCHNETVSKVG